MERGIEQAAVSERPRMDGLPVEQRLTPFLGAALVVVGADQVTKAMVRDWLPEGHVWPARDALLRLAHVENPGAAFGILPGAGDFLPLISLIGSVAIVAYLLLAPIPGRWHAFGLGLVLGGATGNLIDRVLRGTVTDFIDPINYPAFNLADSAIVIGVAVLIGLTLLRPDGDTSEVSP